MSLPISNATLQSGELKLASLTQAAAALRAGKLPTSDQIAVATQNLLQSGFMSPELGSRFAGKVGGGKLSAPGKEVVQRTRQVLEALLRLGLEKNADNKIQRFIFAASQAVVDVDANIETPDIPLPSSGEIAEARDSLKQLLQVLLTSEQLRSTITDGVMLFRDLFADAADAVAEQSIRATKLSKKAAKEARPTEQDREEGKTGLEGKDLFDAKDLKKQALRSVEDAKDDAEKALYNKVKEAKTYFDEELPTDAKDAIIERFKAIVNEIQADPQYKDSIDTIFSLVQKYANLATSAVKEAAAESTASVETNKHADSAASLFREIVEAFTGPLDGALGSLDAIFKHVESDERIKSLLKDASELVDRAIHDPGYATSSKAQRRAEALYDRAQELVKSNATWKQDADKLVEEVQAAADKAKNDDALVGLGRSLERLRIASRKFGRRGYNLVDARAIWGDVTQVLLPRIMGAVKQIPLPRVEYTSADFDFVIDGVNFTSPTFLPDATYLTNHNELSLKRGYAAFASNFETTTTLSFAGLRLQAKDISYFFAKKTGWIILEDAGLLDISVGSERYDAQDGLDLTFTLENASEEDQETFFVLKKVEAAVQGFDIRIHGSRHPISNWLASGTIRKHIEAQFISAIEEQSAALFKQFDQSLFVLQQRAIGAGHAAPDPAAFLKAMVTSAFSGSSSTEYKETGITKIGANGEYILAIGVDEQLLPGRLTGLGLLGQDVTAEKRSIEGIIEDGKDKIDDVQRRLEAIGEATGDTADKLGLEFDERLADERRQNGWKSSAFDI